MSDATKRERRQRPRRAHRGGRATVGALPPGVAPDDILRFPRGPSAGECLHAIFEHIDFTDPAGWNDGIDRGLFAHPQFLPGVRAAEQAPLLAGDGRADAGET